MTNKKYPNESDEYRAARNALLAEEETLIARIRDLAERRRQLPRGGKLPEDYVFVGANNDNLGQELPLSSLFGDKDTLMIYSYMFGPNWDKPCLSCTSLVDGFDRAAFSVGHDVAFVVVTAAPAQKLNDWANSRGWQQVRLVSAEKTDYLRDYQCQTGDDDKSLWPV
ncbi:MAG: DUF899 family protein, partial [Gammaproteobacteria bacterium]|nr:DUF899 family protein [Gammaproteobacteria bacterium]